LDVLGKSEGGWIEERRGSRAVERHCESPGPCRERQGLGERVVAGAVEDEMLVEHLDARGNAAVERGDGIRQLQGRPGIDGCGRVRERVGPRRRRAGGGAAECRVVLDTQHAILDYVGVAVRALALEDQSPRTELRDAAAARVV